MLEYASRDPERAAESSPQWSISVSENLQKLPR
jgi:hypothetical protein